MTVHVMRAKGEKFQRIAQKLGTNTMRVGEVLNGQTHPSAAEEARKLLSL